MINLLIYINPSKYFNQESDILAKIQIDNSLELGWKKENIVFVTNFTYQYRSIRSTVVEDKLFCPFRPLSTKTITASYLLEKKMLPKNELYWVHDLDAFQDNPFEKGEPSLNHKDLGLSDYGWSPKWGLGSYFFNQKAGDILALLTKTIYDKRLEDEVALVSLTQDNSKKINSRLQKLNITYNFGMRHVAINYHQADKPLKVIHFHPWTRGSHVLDSFMYGKNGLGIPLMSKRLIKIFNQHGIH